MEILASFLNPSQMGQIRDVTKSVSLDDVAEVATSGFRSMGTTREDSLVFVLGLLNLGTVLCYAVYSQLFKPNRRGSSALDENHFVMKKIQTILDELVLHVHTTTYYRSSLERTQDLASKRDSTFRPRSSDSSSIRSLFTIFDLPESLIYSEKEPPAISQFSSRRSSDDYDSYLQREAKKMIQEWLSFLVQSTPLPFLSRTRRHTLMSFPNRYRRNTTAGQRRWSIRKRIGRPSTLAPSTSKPVTQAVTKTSTTAEPHPEWTLNQEAMSQLRRPQMKRLVAAATGAEADGRVLAAAQAAVAVARSSSEPDVSHPAHQDDVPVLPVHALFPQGTVRARGIGSSHSKSDRSSSSRSGMRIENGPTEKPEEKSKEEAVTTPEPKPQSEPRHIPSEFRQQMYNRHPMEQVESPYDLEDSASMVEPAEEESLIVRLMHLIQQTTPLAMDVLDVYKSRSVGQQATQSTEPKCLERLLCQLNQDWKGRGSVPAAMAPFLR
ncbi:hypothetical protein GHT06_012950 [Daphnia sinensis]|uniref:Uncharacterized protein n=1 Tax=Daphnia sinensis TaxID=1820382 RepID=A0AAD5KX10_9CRUS|nr:hypothetical protein GHT06_012950 [Daphnia sinensis]